MQYLTLWDLVLTPLYLILIRFLALRHRDKNYGRKHPLRPYYMPGLYVKLGGAVFIALVYQYYYGGGDTFHYFKHAQIINSALDKSAGNWLQLLLRVSPDQNAELYEYTSQMVWYNDPATYMVARITAVLGLLNGTSYLPIALLFAYISFSGIWAMYRTFVNLYPELHKQLAVAFLFIPSTFVWGSAIFKDTVCMFALGWMVFCTFRVFINGDFSVRNLLLLALSFYLVAVVKIYILLAFIPALGLWLLLTYSHRIQSVAVRFIANIAFLGLVAGAFLFFTSQFADELNRYSLENIAQTAEVTRSYIGYVTDMQDGSGYDLGEFDPSFTGMLTKFPQAVIVTFYRPFVWEAGKVIVALSALEALIFLYFSLRVLLARFRSLRYALKDPALLFCLVFSLIFAFAVGISSYNFGALSRYKIPCLPFFATALTILLYKQEKVVVFKRSRPKTLATTA